MDKEFDFRRYLAAKKSVDDRALNKDVWQTFLRQLSPAPDMLEIGAGIGTMLERLVEAGDVRDGRYTGIDQATHHIEAARARAARVPPTLAVELEACDLFDFVTREGAQRQWDVLIAHAFLDLMDVPALLPQLFSLLKPGGLFYFTINFDGVTALEPAIEPAFDVLVEQLYHQTMDERVVDGRLSGDSRSGRHLFTHLRRAGADILAAGSSDWVVFAGRDGYPADEAYFLHFIVRTMAQALRGHPDLDAERFSAWIAQRQAQIDAGELVYIAHQLDVVGRSPAAA